MDHVYASVEGRRLAEEYELGTGLELLHHPFHSLEIDCLELSRAVADPYAEPLLVYDFRPDHPGPYLDIGHVRPYVADPDIRTPVNVSERIQAQQLADSAYGKLLLQQGGSLGADSRKKLNVHI